MKNAFVICTLGLILAAAPAASAGTITLTVGGSGDNILGDVIPPLQGGGQAVEDVTAVNALLGMALDSSDGAYYRSANDFGILPAAAAAGAVLSGSIGDAAVPVLVTTGAGMRFAYLLATYDGKNAGTQVWYIGNLPAGTEILIPRYAELASGHLAPGTTKHKISHWTLLNPALVPDGGSVAILLGIALIGLAVLRRFLK